MAWFMRSSNFTLITLALTLGFATNLPVQAQLRTVSLSSQLPAQWNPPSSPEPSAPVNRESGGIRGNTCQIPPDQRLLSLVPVSGVGTTTEPYPTIFWYMPQSRASAVEFVLKDANKREVYSVKYNLAQSPKGVVGTPGIMSLTLPASANFSPLKIGQTYYWDLALICINPEDGLPQEVYPYISGGIQRIQASPNLPLQLQRATSKEKVALYAQAGDWYETLRSLVELKRDAPNDPEVIDAWEKLLDSVDLEKVYQQPGFESANGGTIND